MKKIIITIAALLLVGASLGAKTNPEDVLGYWYNAETAAKHSAIIKIEQDKDGTFYGFIYELKDPVHTEGPRKGLPYLDTLNKDESLRTRPIEGIKLIEGFTFQEKGGKYKNGTIYNPEDGKTYYSSMQLRKDGKLKVRGSIDKLGWLGVTQIWSRAPEPTAVPAAEAK